GIVSLATVVNWLLFPFFESANLVMIYLVGVIAVATRTGRGPSLLASALSVAVFDFFFVPPFLTFAVSDVLYVITFIIMLLGGLVTSILPGGIRAQALAAREREQRTASLYAMSRELASTRGVDQLLAIAVRHISEVFRGKVVLLLPDVHGRLSPWPGGQY